MRLWMCGFEQGSTGVFTSVTGTPTISTSRLRTGLRSFYTVGAGNYAQKTFSVAGVVEVYSRIAVNFPSDGVGNGYFATFRDSGGTGQITLGRDALGKLTVFRGTTLIATGSIVMSLDVFYCIEVYLKIADSGGRVLAKIDGVSDTIDFTGDTKQSTLAEVAMLRLGTSVPGDYIACYFDDVAVNDVSGAVNNTWPGQGGIVALFPSEPGEYDEWTPSTGANWDCVEEAPPSDANYVSSATSAKKDSYGMPAMPGPGVISAVCWWARAKKDGAGDKNFKRLLRIGGTDYESAAVTLSTSIAYYSEILEASPVVPNDPWTVVEVDGMDVGASVA